MAEGLTPKQQRFVAEYLVDLNGKQAAIRTGYSAKTAEQQASRLLSNVRAC
jgi:phage terminase small subunit